MTTQRPGPFFANALGEAIVLAVLIGTLWLFLYA